MGRVGSWPLRLTADDDAARRREQAESERTLALARAVNQRAARVAEKVRRMNELYRERLEGVRDPQR